LMYFFIWNTCCMVANPVKCHIDCCDYFSHILKFMSIQIRVSVLQLPLKVYIRALAPYTSNGQAIYR
jgi:hypothetical protein